MFVPIVARFDDGGLDVVEDSVEGLDRVRMRCMRFVENKFFFRCCIFFRKSAAFQLGLCRKSHPLCMHCERWRDGGLHRGAIISLAVFA